MKKNILIFVAVFLVIVLGINIFYNRNNDIVKPKVDSKEFNYEKRSVMLNSGYEMPIIGLGTWTLENKMKEIELLNTNERYENW